MDKLHSAQDAIEQAIIGGFWDYFELLPIEEVRVKPDGSTFSVIIIGSGMQVERPINDIFSDPLFWQALGKARGWKKDSNYRPHRIGSHSDGYGGDSDYLCKCDIPPDWKDVAIKWFENRLSGGDETKFWESLP